MSLDTKIKPINDQHSIKEAVLSLFLPNPIIKPSRFKDLIHGKFNAVFHQFEPVQQFTATIKNEKGVITSNSFKTENDVGFRFISFSGGKVEKVFQCMNQDKRNFFAYHDLKYIGWTDFFSNFKKIIEVVSNYEPSTYINGFSIHYIDEFLWIDRDNLIDISCLFNVESKYLPKEFFTEGTTNYSFVTKGVLDDGTTIFDRLEIKVEPKVVPKIVISHNITQPLSDFVKLSEVISDNFSDHFKNVHERNKALLKDVLKPEVCKRIDIK